MLLLSAKPCVDGQWQQSHHQEDVRVHHSHQENQNDPCPIRCICNCCGLSMTFTAPVIFNLISTIDISRAFVDSYQPTYRFHFLSNIWQPPRGIH